MTEDFAPEGFERHTRRSGLTAPWEPIYARHTVEGVVLAIRAREPHSNSRGFVHGGLISALADNAMGLSCGKLLGSVTESSSGLVTVSLTVDFIGSAKIGQWIEIRPTVIKTGKSLCFASAIIMADESVCARASGVFKVLTSRP